MLYFAYGSNMSQPRIEQRIQGVRVKATAVLPGHRLGFHKISVDGSGKGCFEKAGTADRVHGVVFDVAPLQLSNLDRFEGLGQGYERIVVDVFAEGEQRIQAMTYRAIAVDRGLQPYTWYREHVVRGAAAHGLPGSYVEAIRRVPAIRDTDQDRETRELSIYEEQVRHLARSGEYRNR